MEEFDFHPKKFCNAQTFDSHPLKKALLIWLMRLSKGSYTDFAQSGKLSVSFVFDGRKGR